MPKQKTDDLLQLIRSLTRAEKRHFRVFVRRNQSSNDILFLQLFDFLDKYKEYKEPLLLKKIPDIKKSQLSNLKAHLYKQLLTSLRMLSKVNNEDILIREQTDYARVLYNKGLYGQALEILNKVKTKAAENGFYALNMEIIEFEKLIEGQYINRSIAGKAEELTKETLILSEKIYRSNQFSNLSLQMYGLYLKVGFVRNEKDYFFVQEFFRSKLPNVDYQKQGFWAKLYYCQAYFWLYHITHEFRLCYRYAQQWVNLFHDFPKAITLHAPLYLKGLHNLLLSLYNTLQYEKYAETLKLLEQFPNTVEFQLNQNMEGLYYLYLYIHKIKMYFMEGRFDEGIQIVPGLMQVMENDRYNWDQHRVMVFYYRIACLYFGSGDNETAIDYLNLIINQKNPDYREDIQIFARILNLIAHFELDNQQLVEYQVKSVYRFLGKLDDLHEVQKEIFFFLRKTPRMQKSDTKKEFAKLHSVLQKLEQKSFTRRPFLYLDIISWLESKIQNVPVQEVIRKKFEEKIIAN